MTHPILSLLIENPNLHFNLASAIEGVGEQVKRSNLALQSAKGSISLEHQYKEIISNSCKLELIKLADHETAGIRYGVGGSHVWIAVNGDKGWERVAIVTFENFEA